uniref:Uncharacterized protein n=1 Tax=Anguilla anguilla TaxID=7936 RepID=A0A0E9QPA9_ANGAN
MEFSADFHPLR